MVIGLNKKIFLAILFCFFVFLSIPFFAHAAPVSMTGYAWSSNIGWINVSGPNYQVTVDDITGDITGYAWSSNIGWIRFDGLSDCPGTNDCNAHFNFSTSEFDGWIRACVGTINGDCSTMESRTDGWDGWISLNCSNTGSCATSDYKWYLSGAVVEGYAWGNDVLGWVDANNIQFGLMAPTTNLGIRILGSGGSFTSTSPFNINVGDDIELEWSSVGATSCAGTVSGDPAAGGFITSGATSGTLSGSLTEPSEDTSATYTLICNNSSGSDSVSITVNTLSATVHLEAIPQIVGSTGLVDLVWNIGSNDPSACSINGPNGYMYDLSGLPSSGTIFDISVDGESTFTLTCLANGVYPGTSDSVKVQISGIFLES